MHHNYRHSDAIPYYSQVLESNPSQATALLNMGAMFHADGDFDRVGSDASLARVCYLTGRIRTTCTVVTILFFECNVGPGYSVLHYNCCSKSR